MPKLKKLDIMDGDAKPDKMPTSFRCEPIAKTRGNEAPQLGIRFWYWEEDQHFG
jgi:hypothetical protein